MRSRPGLLAVAFLALGPSSLPAQATLEQDYLRIYVALNNSESEEMSGDVEEALARFEDCYCQLRAIHTLHPEWQRVLMTSRLEDCKAKIEELEPKVTAVEKARAAGGPVGGGMAAPSAPTLIPPVVPFSSQHARTGIPTLIILGRLML